MGVRMLKLSTPITDSLTPINNHISFCGVEVENECHSAAQLASAVQKRASMTSAGSQDEMPFSQDDMALSTVSCAYVYAYTIGV